MDRELTIGGMGENSKANLSMARKRVKVIFGAQICQSTSVNFDKTASKGDSLEL